MRNRHPSFKGFLPHQGESGGSGGAEDEYGSVDVIPIRTEDGRIACARCSVANRPWTRLRGLLGRSGLAPDEGMLFPGTASIHTMFMRFAIDVVFLDAELRVLAVREAVPAWRAVKQRGAKATLELAAGEAARLEIGVGDVLLRG